MPAVCSWSAKTFEDGVLRIVGHDDDNLERVLRGSPQGLDAIVKRAVPNDRDERPVPAEPPLCERDANRCRKTVAEAAARHSVICVWLRDVPAPMQRFQVGRGLLHQHRVVRSRLVQGIEKV